MKVVVVVAMVVAGLSGCGGGASRFGRSTASPTTERPRALSLVGVPADDPAASAVSTTTVPPAPPDGTVPATAAPVTSAPCAVSAGGVLPSVVAGYDVVTDESGLLGLLALPPGMQGAGLVHVHRGDGAAVDVGVVAGSGYAFGTLSDLEVLHRFARSAGAAAEPVPVAVGGRTGVAVRTSSGATMYAWMPCRNIIEAVVGTDAAMVADVKARVAG